MQMFRRGTLVVALTASLTCLCGCPDEVDIDIDDDDVFGRLLGAVDIVQTRSPREIVLPQPIVDQGDTIIINNEVTVITNVRQDLIVEDLPDSLVIGFENLTGYDIYVKYFVDGDTQGVYIYDGETLLLDYPCITVVDLVSEDDIDPDTGLLVQSFDLFSTFELGFDYDCGDALIITIDPFDVTAEVQVVDLLN